MSCEGCEIPQPAFFDPIDEEKPWGVERLAALVPGVATLKVLFLRAGEKGRLQRHHRKDEAGHLMSGRLIIRWVKRKTIHQRIVNAGESFHFPLGAVHQEEAVKDCVILEVSTPYLNDREGAETELGMPVPAGALPDTKLEDVVEVQPWW